MVSVSQLLVFTRTSAAHVPTCIGRPVECVNSTYPVSQSQHTARVLDACYEPHHSGRNRELMSLRFPMVDSFVGNYMYVYRPLCILILLSTAFRIECSVPPVKSCRTRIPQHIPPHMCKRATKRRLTQKATTKLSAKP